MKGIFYEEICQILLRLLLSLSAREENNKKQFYPHFVSKSLKVQYYAKFIYSQHILTVIGILKPVYQGTQIKIEKTITHSLVPPLS